MFKPVGNRVAIKPNEEETKTQSGIYIPEESDGNSLKFGEVIAVGNGQWQNGNLIPMTVKVGDKVAFPKFSLTELRYDNEKYYVVDETQIVAIM